MICYSCDLCGKELKKKEIRYIAKVDLYAAADKLEITREDLERDNVAEIRKLLEVIKDADPDKLMEDVFVSYKFDLCKGCRDVLSDHLSKGIIATISMPEIET